MNHACFSHRITNTSVKQHYKIGGISQWLGVRFSGTTDGLQEKGMKWFGDSVTRDSNNKARVHSRITEVDEICLMNTSY